MKFEIVQKLESNGYVIGGVDTYTRSFNGSRTRLSRQPVAFRGNVVQAADCDCANLPYPTTKVHPTNCATNLSLTLPPVRLMRVFAAPS